MVDQNTSITPTPASPQTPAAAPAGYDTVVVTVPPQGQTTTVAVVPATEYQIEAPDVSFTKDGNNLVAQAADGGTVVFEDYFTFASSELPPALTLADGAVIPQEQIMAELGNPDLNAAEPAAGPGAGAGATGGLNGGGAAFAAYDPGDIGTGLSTLDLLGNLDLAFAPPPPPQDPGITDLAEGSLSIEVTTTTTVPEIPGGIPGGVYSGAFEDNRPNANIGDATVATPVLNVIFTPADDEVVTQTTLTGFPIGVQLTLSDGTVIDITTADQQVILAPGLQTGIQITGLPANSDADFDVTAVVEIQDTTTGLQTATLTVTGTVVVDAVADQATINAGVTVTHAGEATGGDILVGVYKIGADGNTDPQVILTTTAAIHDSADSGNVLADLLASGEYGFFVVKGVDSLTGPLSFDGDGHLLADGVPVSNVTYTGVLDGSATIDGVIQIVQHADGSYTVGIEDGSDGDYNDLVLNVSAPGGSVTVHEDNAIRGDGNAYIDGHPAFNIGFATNQADTDGSEEITRVAVTVSGLSAASLAGGTQVVFTDAANATTTLWNASGAETQVSVISVPGSEVGSADATVLVEVTATTTADGVLLTMVPVVASGVDGDGNVIYTPLSADAYDAVQVSSLNLNGLGVILPQHSDDNFSVRVAVTTEETSLTGGEITDANNTATQTHDFNVDVQAVADVATNLGAASEVMHGAALVVSEDGSVTPTFTAAFADNDGSEVHTLTITIPSGWAVDASHLNGWTEVGEGTYSLDVTTQGASVSVAGPALLPPHDSDLDGTITLTATSTEAHPDVAGDVALLTAQTTATYSIVVDADADEPTDVAASASLSVTTKEGECQFQNVSDWKDVGINVSGVVVAYSTVVGSSASDAASNLVLTTAQGETSVSHATGWGVNAPGDTNSHEVDSMTPGDQSSEAVKMTFDSPASSVTINFGLLFGGTGSDWHPESSNVEKAIVLAYDAAGHLVASGLVSGDQDGKVSYTLDAPAGTTISTVYVVATNAAGEGNFSDFIVTGAGYTPAGSTVITEGATVTITASATFGDVTDGSEQHYILVEVPAGATNVTADGAVVSTFTIAEGGNPAYPGVAAGTYVQVPVNGQLGLGDTSATVHVSFTAPNVGVDTSYHLDTYGMAVETLPPSSGVEHDTSDNIAIVAGDTVIVDVADTLPTIVGADSITVSVAEGPAVSSDHGTLTFDFGADTTGATVAFTNAAGQILTLAGANGSEQVTVISNSGATMVVADANGNDITLKVTSALNSCGLMVATITATLPAGDAFDHLSDGNTESVLTISGINVTGTDNEHVDSVTGHVTVAVTDDLPTLSITSALSSYVETTSASGTLHVDAGADDLQSLVATVNGVEVVLTQSGAIYTGTTAFGTLTLNLATNSWTISGLPNLADDATVTLGVTATDKDNDTVHQDLSFTVKDSVPAIISGDGLRLTVTEGDVVSSAHGNVVFSFGKDTADASVVFDYHVGDTLVVHGGETVSVLSVSGTTMTVGDGQGNIIQLSIGLGTPDANGRVTATITATLPAGDAFDHVAGGTSLTIEDVKLLGTDHDGDLVSGSVDVVVKDDVPEVDATITSGSSNVGQTQELGAVGGAMELHGGADGLASLTATIDGVTVTLTQQPDGSFAYSSATVGTLTVTVNASGIGTWNLVTPNVAVTSLHTISFTATDTEGDTDVTNVLTYVVGDHLPKIEGTDKAISLTLTDGSSATATDAVVINFGTDIVGSKVTVVDGTGNAVHGGSTLAISGTSGPTTATVTSVTVAGNVTTIVAATSTGEHVTLTVTTTVTGDHASTTVTAQLTGGDKVFSHAGEVITISGLSLLGTDGGNPADTDHVTVPITVAVGDAHPDVSASVAAGSNVAAVGESALFVSSALKGDISVSEGADGLAKFHGADQLTAEIKGSDGSTYNYTLVETLPGIFVGLPNAPHGDDLGLMTLDTNTGKWTVAVGGIEASYSISYDLTFSATDRDGDVDSATVHGMVIDTSALDVGGGLGGTSGSLNVTVNGSIDGPLGNVGVVDETQIASGTVGSANNLSAAIRLAGSGGYTTFTDADHDGTYTATVGGETLSLTFSGGHWSLTTSNISGASVAYDLKFSGSGLFGIPISGVAHVVVVDSLPVASDNGISVSLGESASGSAAAGASVVVDFGYDKTDGAAAATVTFAGTAGISVAGMSGITWASADGGATLIGSQGGVEVIKLAITTGPGTQADQIAATVTATLLNGHVINDAGSSGINISGVSLVGTDTDGDTVTVPVTVSISDGVPSIVATGSDFTMATEGVDHVTGSLVIHGGADGLAAVDGIVATIKDTGGNVVDTVSLVSNGSGGYVGTSALGNVVTLGSDGTWTLTPGNVDGAFAEYNISFTVTDADGDTATSDSYNYIVVDGQPTITSVTTTATVDASALASGHQLVSGSIAIVSTDAPETIQVKVNGGAAETLTKQLNGSYSNSAGLTVNLTQTPGTTNWIGNWVMETAAVAAATYTLSFMATDTDASAGTGHGDSSSWTSAITDHAPIVTAVDPTVVSLDDHGVLTIDGSVNHAGGDGTTTMSASDGFGIDTSGQLSINTLLDHNLDLTNITYTAKDGDGDVAKAAAHFIVHTLGTDAADADLIHDGDTTNDILVGNAHDNQISGGTGNDYLFGGEGNDQLDGGAGNDHLDGGAGNDVLNGGAGNDVLTGGTGADTFQFASVADGHDTITDFQVGPGGDTIDLDALFDALGATAANTEVTITPVSGSAQNFTIGLADATTHEAVHTEFSIDVHTTTDTDAATIKAQVDTHGS